TLWLWAYAKIHGWTSKLLPADTFSLRVFDHLNLERGLIAGAVLVATGLGLNLWLGGEGAGQKLGALEGQTTPRYAPWGFGARGLGVQTVFGSFFLSMLGMAEKARAGKS